MKYDNEFDKRVAAGIIDSLYSIREASMILHVARNTISKWVSRTKEGLPTRFKHSAKKVWNRTSENISAKLKSLLLEGRTTIQAWQTLGKRLYIRTIERWNSVWFPVIKEKKSCRRYVRKKAFSLMHTDWGVKRIRDGKRTCFTFHEDDAT